MSVSGTGASNPFQAVQQAENTGASQKPSDTETAVTKKALDHEKAQGNQVVDMIKKAGSSVNVTA
jgi:glucokinase